MLQKKVSIQSFKDSFSQYHFILSLLLIMAVYLPVNFLGFLNFDDAEVTIRLHENFSDINWVGLFFRDSSSKYYRPLLEVLCYLDYALWGLTTTAYHLTNYIIHILNACLVYLIAFQWFYQKKNAGIWAALAMILFALNPLTCESVAWISGRSDLAGTLFSLLAVYCWFLKSSLRFFLTPLAILSGLLCKENALAVIPIVVLLEFFINYRNKKRFSKNIKSCFVWSIIVLIPLLLYLFLRTNGWENHTYEYINVTKSTTAASQGVTGKIDILKILYLFPVTAFYLKKLIMPFPLNFAIANINTVFYSFLSVVFLGLTIVWFKNKKISYIFFISLLVFSFVPALPVALGNVSWVPMAERYLYMSVSIMAIGAASFLLNFQEKKIVGTNLLITICLIIILILSVLTFQREFVFNDNKSIWTATLKTNPDNSMVLFKYALAVGLKDGQSAYRKAVANPEPFVWRAEALLSIAQYESSIGNNDKAVKCILQALEEKENRKINLYAAYLLMNIQEEDVATKRKHLNMAIDIYKRVYSNKQSAFVLYNIATLLRTIDENQEAEKLFLEIITQYPDSEYAVYASKNLEKLSLKSGLENQRLKWPNDDVKNIDF